MLMCLWLGTFREKNKSGLQLAPKSACLKTIFAWTLGNDESMYSEGSLNGQQILFASTNK